MTDNRFSRTPTGKLVIPAQLIYLDPCPSNRGGDSTHEDHSHGTTAISPLFEAALKFLYTLSRQMKRENDIHAFWLRMVCTTLATGMPQHVSRHIPLFFNPIRFADASASITHAHNILHAEHELFVARE